jgi:hypothetical protein
VPGVPEPISGGSWPSGRRLKRAGCAIDAESPSGSFAAVATCSRRAGAAKRRGVPGCAAVLLCRGVPRCAAVPGCAGVCHCAGVPAPPYRGALAIGEQCNRRQMRFRVDYGIIYYMILGGWPGQLGGPRFGVTNYEFLRTRNS